MATSVRSTSTKQFTIDTVIDGSTFTDMTFLSDTQKYLGMLDSTIFYLDQATFLRDVFYMGNHYFKQLVGKRKSSRVMIREYINWIKNYYIYLSQMTKELHPYCPILNNHPLEVHGGSLFVVNQLLTACTSERKRDISSSYGEGLGLLLLRNYKDVRPFGVLKIHTGSGSTPDFIVINKYGEISLLSEVKSTINRYPSSPANQLKNHKHNYHCLGIQISFNNGGDPVKITIEDPEYELKGDIFSSIFSNLCISLATQELYQKQAEISKREGMLERFMNILDSYDEGELDLSNIIKGNKIITQDKELDAFLGEYFLVDDTNLFAPGE